MTVRFKLMWSYAVMLAAILAVGTVAFWSTKHWQAAADELRLTHGYGVQAERLRLGMYSQINYGLDFLGGQAFDTAEYVRIRGQSRERFAELKKHTLSSEEADHIEGLEETIAEIEFRLERIFLSGKNGDAVYASQQRPRLREIADDVTSDIAVLNQYYRGQVDIRLDAAARAGSVATTVIGIAIVLVILELVALALLTQRWLVRPFALVRTVTEEISGGNLEARVLLETKDEWEELSSSVNHMAKSLKAYQEQLAIRERFSALGEAAAYTAHNIRNPLAGIRAAVQVLQQSGERLSQDDKTTLSEIVTTIDRLSLWVSRFLDFARPLDLQREQCDINEVFGHALVMSTEKAGCKVVDITTALDKEIPVAYIDAVLMEQALSAIITNALQSGGSEVKISSKMTVGKDGDLYTELQVIDNGTGISPEMLEKLFTVFATSKSDGTGLGMAQAKKIVRLHGGEIVVKSIEGSSTEMLIHIPIIKPEIKNLASKASQIEGQS